MLKMLNDCVAVKRREANTIIELVGHKEHIGEVVAVGPGIYRIHRGKEYFQPTVVQPGMYVHFSHRAGQETVIDGETYLIMREPDILCAVDPESIKVTDNAADESRDVVGVFNIA